MENTWESFCRGIETVIGSVSVDEDFDFEAYRPYFNQGMSAADAVAQEHLDSGC